jgi:RHS repeat-associated protein
VLCLYGYDAHGNVTFLTDATGAVTDTYEYDEWGNIVGSTGSTTNTRLYAGEEVDPDLGLVNLRARQYKPSTGRFETLDPVRGNPMSPLSFNRYLYANADPVNGRDPLGLAMAAEGGIVFGGIAAKQIIVTVAQGVAAIGAGAGLAVLAYKNQCAFQAGADILAAVAGEEVVRVDPKCPEITCDCHADVTFPMSELHRWNRDIPHTIKARGVGDTQPTAETRCIEKLGHNLTWHPANKDGNLSLGKPEIDVCFASK